MKKVYQTKFSSIDGKLTGDLGDCWRVCVASFLHLDAEEVPHFMEVAGFGMNDLSNADKESIAVNLYHDFMRYHGFHVMSINTKDWDSDRLEKFMNGLGHAPYFVVGKSFKGDWLHQVIYKDGKLWHDPNGTGKGIEDVQIIEIPILIDPKSQV